MKKRILSLFLAAVMLALAVPAMVFTVIAAEAAAQPTVSTTFSKDSNIPAYKDANGDWIMDHNMAFEGGWSFGALHMTTQDPATLADVSFTTTLTAYNARNHTSDSNADYISNITNGWNQPYVASGTVYGAGAMAFLKADGRPMLCSGTKTDSTGITQQVAAAAIRYTAQYSGDVTVTIKGDWFYKDHESGYVQGYTEGYAYIWVLKNGTKIKEIVQDENLVDVQVSTTLAKDDKLDFVVVIDPEYSTADASSTVTGFKREAVNRNFIVDELTVEFSNVVASATATSKLNGISAASNTVKYAYNSEEVRFFQWYDANHNPINAGGTLSAGCYAKLNPEMVTAAGIDLENDTYAKAYEKYLALLMKANVLTYANSDWSLGHMTTGGTFSELKYPLIHVGKNLALVDSTGKVGYPCDTSYNGSNANAGLGSLYVALSSFEKSYATLKSNFATYVPDDTVKAGTVSVAYNDAMKSLTLGEARHNITVMPMGRFQANTRGGSSWGYAAYRYTASKSGTVTFTVNAFDAASGGTMSWKVVKNGAVSSATDTVTHWQNDLNSYKTGVAAMSFTVEAGDTIEFLFAESSGADGFRPTITASLVYNPMDWAVEGQLAIDSNYSVSALAAPADPNGVMSAVVDGQKIAGVKQANGSYKMLLKGGIYITDLTDTVVTYTLQEETNGHVIKGVPREMDVDVLLSKYEAHEVPEIARLAKDIRLLADYVNYKFGKSGEPAKRTDMKYSLEDLKAVSKDYTFGGTAGDFKIIAANVHFDDSLRLLLLVDAANANASKWDLIDVEGYEMKVYDGDTALDFEVSKFGTQEKDGVTYIGVLVEVPVSYWSRQITFAVEKDGVAVSRTLNYSHNTWCAWLLQKNLKADGVNFYSDGYVALGVYNVGQSAAAYLAYVAANA